MKEPKIKIPSTLVKVAAGIAIILFAVLALLSPNVFGLSWISTGVLASIGFTGFWVFIPTLIIIGLYIIFSKKLGKFKIDLSIIGLVVMIVGASVLVTNILLTTTPVEIYPAYASLIEGEDKRIYLDMSKVATENGDIKKYLEMNSFIYYFMKISELGFVGTNSALGGGFLCFMLAGMLNSAMTPVGTTIVSIVVIVIGLGLVLNLPIREFFKFIIGKIKGTKKKEEPVQEEDDGGVYITNNDPQVLIPVTPIEESKQEPYVSHEPIPERKVEVEQPREEIKEESEPLFDDLREERSYDQASLVRNSFNNSHTLQKAKFSFEGETLSEMEEPSFNQQPTFSEARFDDGLPSFMKEEPQQEYQEPTYEEVAPSYTEPAVNDIPSQEAAPAPQPQVTPQVQPKPVEPENPLAAKADLSLGFDIASRKPRPAKPLRNYVYPSTDLIKARENEADKYANKESNDARMNRINEIFEELSIGAHAISYTVGPTFTRFDIQMDTNRSVTTIDRYIPDLASRLNGIPVRFQKLVIGKPTSGLEIGNDVRTNVGLKECLEALPPVNEKTRTLIAFGKDIDNKLIYADLTKFPHMLVAGSTGSGKSVFVHSVISTLIIRNKPDELKLLLVDPKRVEMNIYHDIPHLLCPNISEPQEAFVALNKLCEEMERRYELFRPEFVNDIKDYNEIMVERGLEKLPFIIVFVDEYADLSESCKEIRSPVVRIAQKARAAGIHLVLATQRPSVNVIDGVIKANISTHVALSVNSYVDSNVIIGENGAEQLLGNGDMIVDCPIISRQNKPRLQGAYCSLGEVNKICEHIRKQMPPQYDPAFLDLKDHSQDNASSFSDAEPTKVDKDVADDELYKMIKEDTMTQEFTSISKIQRGYGIGFPRAGRMFAKLQNEGIVATTGDAKGSKVLVRTPINNEPQMGTIEQSTLVVTDDEE